MSNGKKDIHLIKEEMERDWDRRAKKDAFYYIATGNRITANKKSFFASGEKSAREILDDVDPLLLGRETVLEIGCGAGWLLKPLASQFQEVYGVDVSGEMVRIGKELLADYKNIHLYHNDGVTLSPLPDKKFDFVFSYIVFQHIPSREIVRGYIREALRVLKPGGIFKFQVRGFSAYEEEIWPRGELQDYNTWVGAGFNQQEILYYTAEAGFEIVSSYIGPSRQYLWVIARRPSLTDSILRVLRLWRQKIRRK